MSETQTTAPTPGPWAVDADVVKANGVFVADCDDPNDGARGIANAAHIVKCVNERPALIAERDRLAHRAGNLEDALNAALSLLKALASPDDPIANAVFGLGRAALGEGK